MNAHFDKNASPQYTLSYTSCQQEHDSSNRETCRNKPCSKPSSVPTVSKQFWFEAAAAFLESSTFDFSYASAFEAVATSGQAYVPRIRRICLRDNYGLSAFGRIWDSAMNSSIVGLLEGLRGVHLQLNIEGSESVEVRKGDMMENSYWQLRPFQKVLRSLKQHRLDEKSTAVGLVRHTYVPGMLAVDISEDHRIEEIIKKELLEHHPPRRSTRGRNGGA